MPSSSNWTWSLKVALISTGVLFTALILKISVPALTEFAFTEIPLIWSVVVSWLRPPYLYVVINGIIITIVASSKLQQKLVGDSPPDTVAQPAPINVSADYAVVYDGVVLKDSPVEVRPEFGYDYDASVAKGSELDVYEHMAAEVLEPEIKTINLAVNAGEEVTGEDELAVSRSLWTPPLNSTEYSFPAYEKPPVSVRIGHRKAVKPTPEGGRILGVSKPKRHETLETTWKTITDGRPMPLTRHLKKSDTWETHGRGGHLQLQEHDHKMAKSETFHDRTTATASAFSSLTPPPGPTRLRRDPSGSGKLRKEPSPGQDELNRRVEAFIKKFNEDMKLQRQESLNQYMEMINRGAH